MHCIPRAIPVEGAPKVSHWLFNGLKVPELLFVGTTNICLSEDVQESEIIGLTAIIGILNLFFDKAGDQLLSIIVGLYPITPPPCSVVHCPLAKVPPMYIKESDEFRPVPIFVPSVKPYNTGVFILLDPEW